MKKLLIVAAFAATSTVASAFDYKFNLEGRADFVNSNVKNTINNGGATTTDKYNNFSNNLIRLNMMGTINENLSYRFRYRFSNAGAKPTTGGAARESVNTDANGVTNPTSANGVDYLYVDHKNSIFTTRFGKQSWTEAYGREEFVAGTDVFLTSLVGTDFKKAVGDYRYGVTAMFKFMDTNNLSLAVSNPNPTISDSVAPTAAAPERKNTSLTYAAHYNGSFVNKLVQPVLAYTISQQDGDTDATATAKTKKANYTLWNAGLRSEVAGAVIDADYKQFKKANRNDGTNVTSANKEQKTKSIYANVAYAVGDFTPMVTYINDKYTTEETVLATDANFKRNSFAVGTFWKPYSDINFRYHLMVTNAVTKYEGAVATNSKVKDTKVYFGFKADI